MSRLFLLLFSASCLLLLSEGCSRSKKRSSKNVPLVRSRKAAADGKVAVDVYYETLCPDSKWFFLHQLVPTIKSQVGQYIDLRLVPYGHATTTVSGGNLKFTCQHGPLECQGNMVHACAIKTWQEAATDKTEVGKVNYLTCMIANNRRPLSVGERCAERYGVNWSIVKRCYNEEGKRLLKTMGELTPKTSFVPHVTVNGATTKVTRRRSLFFPYSTKSSVTAYRNLKSAVCKTKPVEGC